MWIEVVRMKKKKGAIATVVPRIGSVVEREACVGSGLEGSEK